MKTLVDLPTGHVEYKWKGGGYSSSIYELTLVNGEWPDDDVLLQELCLSLEFKDREVQFVGPTKGKTRTVEAIVRT